MGIFSNLLMGSVAAATAACIKNDLEHSLSRPRKIYKSLERQGKIIRMINSLERELEKIEDDCYSPDVELHLKLVAFNTVFTVMGRTMSREQVFAERELRRHGNIGPIYAMAKQDQRLADLFEEYILNG